MSIFQPPDQGIIKPFKYYCHMHLERKTVYTQNRPSQRGVHIHTQPDEAQLQLNFTIKNNMFTYNILR
jgi:hypothetical protein